MEESFAGGIKKILVPARGNRDFSLTGRRDFIIMAVAIKIGRAHV